MPATPPRRAKLFFTGFGRKQAFAGDIRTFRFGGGLKALRDLVNEPGHGQVLVIDGAGIDVGKARAGTASYVAGR